MEARPIDCLGPEGGSGCRPHACLCAVHSPQLNVTSSRQNPLVGEGAVEVSRQS